MLAWHKHQHNQRWFARRLHNNVKYFVKINGNLSDEKLPFRLETEVPCLGKPEELLN